MARIVVIGAGVMSSAFALAQAYKHSVSIIPAPFDDTVVSNIQRTQVDNRLGVAWSGVDFIQAEDVSAFDYIVIGVSSQGIPWALDIVKTLLQKGNSPVLLLTKGLIEVEGKLTVLSVYLESLLKVPVISITGPCIAKLLAEKAMTHVVFSSQHTLDKVVTDFSLPFYVIEASEDVIGTQWLAALKNVYAILIAKAGDNTNQRSTNFAKACQEMMLWVSEQGGDPKTVMGLSGVGDLYVTCQGGRNGLLGQYLSEGLSLEAILTGPMKGVTVEGLDVAKLLRHFSCENKPLFQGMLSLLS